jgi:predicted MFS family arabinose efflux permease
VLNVLHIRAAWIGAINMVLIFAALCATLAVVPRLGNVKPADVVVRALASSAVACALLYFVHSGWALCVVLCLFGLCAPPLGAAVMTTAQTECAAGDRSVVIGSLTSAMQAASMVSMAVAGVVAGFIGARATFVCAAVVMMCGSAIARFLYRGSGPGESEGKSDRSPTGARSVT